MREIEAACRVRVGMTPGGDVVSRFHQERAEADLSLVWSCFAHCRFLDRCCKKPRFIRASPRKAPFADARFMHGHAMTVSRRFIGIGCRLFAEVGEYRVA